MLLKMIGRAEKRLRGLRFRGLDGLGFREHFLLTKHILMEDFFAINKGYTYLYLLVVGLRQG